MIYMIDEWMLTHLVSIMQIPSCFHGKIDIIEEGDPSIIRSQSC